MLFISWPPPNLNLIREMCDSNGKYLLIFFVGNGKLLGYWLNMTVQRPTTVDDDNNHKNNDPRENI